jgi:NhaA family Na+:H+ antiporter
LFVNAEVSSGIVLIIVVILAMIIANSPLSEDYFSFWLMPLSLSLGEFFSISKPIILWINDGLMAIFFLLVGLEIKREILVGELASKNKAMLPVFAALGGMSVPALIYIFFNINSPFLNAWAIPVATDIAFSLGILALVGNRVPVSLKLFLASFAIVDDIGAVLIIALFYTNKLALDYLILAFILLVLLFGFNLIGGKNLLVYLSVGLVIWLFILQSGIHATIAGVLLAIVIPASKKTNIADFKSQTKGYLEIVSNGETNLEKNELNQATINQLKELCKNTQTPLQDLEHRLTPWVFFLIVPIFAFANAGINIAQTLASTGLLTNPVVLGIFFGLLIGNPIGINLIIYITTRLGIVKLPADIKWIHVLGVSFLAGVGFTMSYFIAGLAFIDDLQILNISRFVIST